MNMGIGMPELTNSCCGEVSNFICKSEENNFKTANFVCKKEENITDIPNPIGVDIFHGIIKNNFDFFTCQFRDNKGVCNIIWVCIYGRNKFTS